MKKYTCECGNELLNLFPDDRLSNFWCDKCGKEYDVWNYDNGEESGIVRYAIWDGETMCFEATVAEWADE